MYPPVDVHASELLREKILSSKTWVGGVENCIPDIGGVSGSVFGFGGITDFIPGFGGLSNSVSRIVEY
jgi:hypothetical protein